MGHLDAAVIAREDRCGRRPRVRSEAQLGTSGNRLLQFALLGLVDADVNADGATDLLVAHSFGLGVMLGDGAGGFVAGVDVEAGLDPRAVAVADLDGDGRLDAAVVNSASQDVTLTLGDGRGGFEYAATYTVGTLPSGIVAADFNEDGVPDLAVSNQLSNNIGLILSNP